MTRKMADSTNVNDLPQGFDLYAGYDDGAWPDAMAIATRFKGKPVIRVTVKSSDNEGDCLDVEKGDATPGDAPGWVVRRRQAGHGGPLVYFSEAILNDVIAAFTAAKVPLPGFWVAAYPGEGNIIPPYAIGHQWIDRGGYDESVMADYLPGIDPLPLTPSKEDMMNAVVLADGTIKVYAASPQGHLLEFTRKEGDQSNSVIDITDEIGGPNPYLVAP